MVISARQPYDCEGSVDGHFWIHEPTGIVRQCKITSRGFKWVFVWFKGSGGSAYSFSVVHDGDLVVTTDSVVGFTGNDNFTSSHVSIGYPNGSPAYNIPGWIATLHQEFYWTGSSWILCRSSNWITNAETSSYLNVSVMSGSRHPCGPGWYGTWIAAAAYGPTEGWVGGWVWSGIAECGQVYGAASIGDEPRYQPGPPTSPPPPPRRPATPAGKRGPR